MFQDSAPLLKRTYRGMCQLGLRRNSCCRRDHIDKKDLKVMNAASLYWTSSQGWNVKEAARADLIFYFGARASLADGKRFGELREMFPDAHVVGCSTGGQIRNNDVSDEEIVAVALSFDATKILNRYRNGFGFRSITRLRRNDCPGTLWWRPRGRFRAFRRP